MRRKDREVTDIDEIEAIINKSSCFRIGFVDDGEPYIVPVCFGYERNAFYFHCASEGRKIEIIRKNNSVCFELDTDVKVVKADKPCKWASKYRSVMGTGTARILGKDEEKKHGLNLIMRQYGGGDFNFSKPALDSVLIVKVDVHSISAKQAGY